MANDYIHLDIGSTVTQAKAWERSAQGINLVGSATAPTPPALGNTDLTGGAHLAYSELKDKVERSGRRFDPQDILVTVSAAGEPRVVCAGVVKGISGESSKRAALAAGATVTDLITVDDGRHEYQRVTDLRRQDISMVVMAGGVDEEILGQGRHQLFNVAKVIAAGLPGRLGDGKKVPVVYAASLEGREEVSRIFGDSVEVVWAENVRARLEEEHLDSARDAIVGVFSSGIRHDARFSGLGRFGAATVLPTGHSIGLAVVNMAGSLGEDVMVISLDGDTVQVFSQIRGVFTRTVSSVARLEAKDVAEWLPSRRLAERLDDILANWKRNPGVLPRSWDDLAVYLAIQKQVVREALDEHSRSAIELRGIHRQRQVGETFTVGVKGGDTLVRMERIGSVFLTGFLAGILSPVALVSIATDALGLHGVTKLYADRDGILPSLGVFGGDLVAAPESFLTPAGVILSPGKNEERVKDRWAVMRTDSRLEELPVTSGEIRAVVIPAPDSTWLELHPSSKGDVGAGEGRRHVTPAKGFHFAYVDARLRHRKPQDPYRENRRGYRALGVFPDGVLDGWERGME
jgi:hypothetical protein